MSLIDKETEIIKTISDKIENKDSREPSVVEGNDKGDTYLFKRKERLKYISEYQFNSPKELEHVLTTFWDELGEKDMLEFIKVSVVSTFKNKPDDRKDVGTKKEVSPYIYEF